MSRPTEKAGFPGGFCILGGGGELRVIRGEDLLCERRQQFFWGVGGSGQFRGGGEKGPPKNPERTRKFMFSAKKTESLSGEVGKLILNFLDDVGNILFMVQRINNILVNRTKFGKSVV